MGYRNDITAEYVRSRLHYDPDTGVFTWKPKPVRFEYSRIDNAWNSREVGTVAGGPSKHGALAISIDNVHYASHRLAWLYMTGEWPPQGIDHKNGIPSDNRWENLRPAGQSENAQNTAIRSDNTSGHTGVSWSNQAGKWYAYINVRGKMRGLGYHVDKQDAINAYLKAKAELHPFQPVPRWSKRKAG